MRAEGYIALLLYLLTSVIACGPAAEDKLIIYIPYSVANELKDFRLEMTRFEQYWKIELQQKIQNGRVEKLESLGLALAAARSDREIEEKNNVKSVCRTLTLAAEAYNKARNAEVIKLPRASCFNIFGMNLLDANCPTNKKYLTSLWRQWSSNLEVSRIENKDPEHVNTIPITEEKSELENHYAKTIFEQSLNSLDSWVNQKELERKLKPLDLDNTLSENEQDKLKELGDLFPKLTPDQSVQLNELLQKQASRIRDAIHEAVCPVLLSAKERSVTTRPTSSLATIQLAKMLTYLSSRTQEWMGIEVDSYRSSNILIEDEIRSVLDSASIVESSLIDDQCSSVSSLTSTLLDKCIRNQKLKNEVAAKLGYLRSKNLKDASVLLTNVVKALSKRFPGIDNNNTQDVFGVLNALSTVTKGAAAASRLYNYTNSGTECITVSSQNVQTTVRKTKFASNGYDPQIEPCHWKLKKLGKGMLPMVTVLPIRYLNQISPIAKLDNPDVRLAFQSREGSSHVMATRKTGISMILKEPIHTMLSQAVSSESIHNDWGIKAINVTASVSGELGPMTIDDPENWGWLNPNEDQISSYTDFNGTEGFAKAVDFNTTWEPEGLLLNGYFHVPVLEAARIRHQFKINLTNSEVGERQAVLVEESRKAFLQALSRTNQSISSGGPDSNQFLILPHDFKLLGIALESWTPFKLRVYAYPKDNAELTTRFIGIMDRTSRIRLEQPTPLIPPEVVLGKVIEDEAELRIPSSPLILDEELFKDQLDLVSLNSLSFAQRDVFESALMGQRFYTKPENLIAAYRRRDELLKKTNQQILDALESWIDEQHSQLGALGNIVLATPTKVDEKAFENKLKEALTVDGKNYLNLLSTVMGPEWSAPRSIVGMINLSVKEILRLALAKFATTGALSECILFIEEGASSSICSLPESAKVELSVMLGGVFTPIKRTGASSAPVESPVHKIIDSFNNPPEGWTRKDIDDAFVLLRKFAIDFAVVDANSLIDESWRNVQKQLASDEFKQQLKNLVDSAIENCEIKTALAAVSTSCERKNVCDGMLAELAGYAVGSCLVKGEEHCAEVFKSVVRRAVLEKTERFVNLALPEATQFAADASLKPTSSEVKMAERLEHTAAKIGRVISSRSKPVIGVDVYALSAVESISSELPLAVNDDGDVVFSESIPQLEIEAGDIVNGIGCYPISSGRTNADCVAPKTLDEARRMLKRTKSNVVSLISNGVEEYRQLAKAVTYRMSLVPVVETLDQLPKAMQKYVNPLEKTAYEAIKNTRELSANLNQLLQEGRQAVVVDAKDVLIDQVKAFSKDCRRLIGRRYKKECSDPSTLNVALFGTELHNLARSRVAKLLSDVSVSDELACNLGVVSQRSDILRDAATKACERLRKELSMLQGRVKRSEDSQVILSQAKGIPNKVAETFGQTLSQATGNALWNNYIALSEQIEFNRYRRAALSYIPQVNGVCVRMNENGIPEKFDENVQDCVEPMNQVIEDVESLQRLKSTLTQKGSQALEKIEKELNRSLTSICIDMVQPLANDAAVANGGQVCKPLERFIKDPETAVQTMLEQVGIAAQASIDAQKDKFRGWAKDQLGRVELGEAIGLEIVNGKACIQQNNVRRCFSSEEEFGNYVKATLKDKGEALLNKLAPEFPGYVDEEIRTVVAESCRAMQKILNQDHAYFGGALKLEARNECPSSDLTVVGTLTVPYFKAHKMIRITGGISINRVALKTEEIVAKGMNPSELFVIDWHKLKTVPSLEDVIRDELKTLEQGVEFERLKIRDHGLELMARIQHKIFPWPLPLTVSLSESGLSVDLADLDKSAITMACREITKYIKREQLTLFEGAVIKDAPPRYCVKRDLRGIQLVMDLALSPPTGTLEISAYIDADKGIRVQMPESKQLAALAFLEAFGLNLVKPTAPFYELRDGLTLYLAASVPTPFDLHLKSEFLVSPKQFKFRGPIELRLPGWYDTSMVSFGQLGISYNPENKEIGLLGSAAIVPGAATNKLANITGRGTLGLRDLEFTLRGGLRVFKMLEVSNSFTRISLPERLFEHQVNTGPMLADIVKVNGEMRIQDLSPNPFFKVRAEGDLLGADIADMSVELNRRFGGHFKAVLDLPVDSSVDFGVAVDDGLRHYTARTNLELPLPPFDVNLEISASDEEIGINLKENRIDQKVGFTLPSFKLLTADYLLKLLGDIQFGLSLPQDFAFESVKKGTEGKNKKGGGDELSLGQNEAKPVVGEKTAGERFLIAYKPVKVKYYEWLEFGIKWRKIPRHKWEWRPVEAARRIAAAVGWNGDDLAKNKAFYYVTEDGYGVLAARTAARQLFITYKGSRIWSGEYSGDLASLKFDILSHRATTGKNPGFVVTSSGEDNTDVNAIRYGAILNNYTEDTRIQGGAALKKTARGSPELSRFLTEQLGAELVWRGRRPNVISIGDQKHLVLVESKLGPTALSTLVHYSRDRTPQAVFIEGVRVSKKADVKTTRELVQALGNHVDLVQALNSICSDTTTTSLNMPCAYAIVAPLDNGSVGTMILETPNTERLGKVHVSLPTITISGDLDLGEILDAKAIVQVPSADLFSLISPLFENIQSDIDNIERMTLSLVAPMRFALTGEKDDTKYIFYVAEDIEVSGNTHKWVRAKRTCVSGLWNRSAGKVLNPEHPFSAGDVEASWWNLMRAMTMPHRYWQKQGWLADPVGSVYQQCES